MAIDTLQRIRTTGSDANSYANDCRDIGVLKALSDRHRIAVLLVKQPQEHHLHHPRRLPLPKLQTSRCHVSEGSDG